MGFQWGRYLYRIGRVGRSRVRDGNNGHHFATFHHLAGGDNCAGPVLAAFLSTLSVFMSPEVGVGNDQAWNRLG